MTSAERAAADSELRVNTPFSAAEKRSRQSRGLEAREKVNWSFLFSKVYICNLLTKLISKLKKQCRDGIYKKFLYAGCSKNRNMHSIILKRDRGVFLP
jgi:hypothetical protein